MATSHHTRPIRMRQRAQGDSSIPAPAGMILEPDFCAVAIKVTVTEIADAEQTELPEQLGQYASFAYGPCEATLTHVLDELFEGPGREVLANEIDQLGWIDPGCPLRLERLHTGEQFELLLEALILPCGEADAAEAFELTNGETDTDMRAQLGWEYALDLEQRWGPVPSRRLDVDFRVSHPGEALVLDIDEPVEREIAPVGV